MDSTGNRCESNWKPRVADGCNRSSVPEFGSVPAVWGAAVGRRANACTMDADTAVRHGWRRKSDRGDRCRSPRCADAKLGDQWDSEII